MGLEPVPTLLEMQPASQGARNMTLNYLLALHRWLVHQRVVAAPQPLTLADRSLFLDTPGPGITTHKFPFSPQRDRYHQGQ